MKVKEIIIMLLLLVIEVTAGYAQGIKVYTKDSTVTLYPYSKLDSVVAYSYSNYSNDEYVDLGLSVKWATRNLGASSPEEYGNYYAWAETEPRTGDTWNYNFNTTPYYKNGKFTKYNSSDHKIVLDPEDDAATVALGSTWRMPTKAELDELISNCEWEWTSMNNVNGYKITGPNHNSIFLPAAGYRNNYYYSLRTSRCMIWTSTLNSSDRDNAFYLNGNKILSTPRYMGQTIRAVHP